MKICRTVIKRTTIEAFAEEHDLVMEVNEREDGFDKNRKFFACFLSSDTIEGGFLVGAFGDGKTEKEAIEQYARRISGKHLVLDAHNSHRKEIIVPILENH